MARKSTSGGSAKSDTSYNARRRETRAAQRYLEKAENTTGALSSRNYALARKHFENALATYELGTTQEVSSSIQTLANRFNVDVKAHRAKLKDLTESGKERYEKRRKEIEGESTGALAGALKDPEKRRESEYRILISNTSIGKRIMGGLVDIWRDSVNSGNTAAENRAAAEKAIFDYFNVSSWADVLQILEDSVGEELYAVGEGLEVYDVVRIAIQKGVVGNTLVQ